MNYRAESKMRAAHRMAVALASILAVIGIAGAAPASAASWETVQNFAPLVPQPPNPPAWPEDVQLGGASGMAINLTGAGGVPAGTVYTVGSTGAATWHAARYSPDGSFELAWARESRCGPAVTPPSVCPAFAHGNGLGVDIAVDQKTGNVFVFYVNEGPKVVREYKADGTGPIAEFGELEASGTAASSPGKLHGSPGTENIAVDDSGRVYILDVDTSTDFFHRIMVFEPETPGDYEHYVYVGQSGDIAAGFSSTTRPPLRPVLDSAGNVYVAGDDYVDKYDLAQPSSPICIFSFPAGGITSLTINSTTGAPFFYSYKDRKIHQLSPCNGEGKFVEKDAEGAFAAGPPFSAVPQRGFIEAMAFNPLRVYSKEASPGVIEEHPAGVLYAAAPTNCPDTGSCPADAQGQSSLGYIFAQPVSHPPVVEAESVTQVGPTSATLDATINPKGSQTSYVFQYLTAAAYEANEPAERFAGASEAPLGGAPLGTGKVGLSASVTLSKLSPGTEYRYRVVATNSDGSTPGSAETFRTFALEAPGLPDRRAWELVSPAQKNGGEVLPAAPSNASCGVECKPGLTAFRFPTQVSSGDDGIAYQGFPFTLNEGAVEYDEFVSTRSSSGWQTRSLGPPLGDHGLFEAFALASDFSSALVYAGNPALTPEAPAGYRNLFAQPGSDRLDLEPLLKATPPNRGPEGTNNGFKLNYVGTSADLSRVFFEANDALTEETPFAPAAVDGGVAKNNLYEWSEGELRLVNVQPGNAEAIPGATFGSGLRLVKVLPLTNDFSNAISADGSRVFWSSESGQVYVRENGETTREIPDHNGKFLTASKDTSKVLLSDGVLYDLQTETSTDLTEGLGGFQGISGQSDDLSHVYFVDDPTKGNEALTHGRGELKEGSTTVELFSGKGTATTTSGSPTLTDVTTAAGSFAPGQQISGAGIPPGTTILAVGEKTLTLSAAAIASGEKVPIRSNVPSPFLVGQLIQAPGIPAGTTIVATGAATLELSAPAGADEDNTELTAAAHLLGSAEENSEGDRPKLTAPNLYAWSEGDLAYVATLLPAEGGNVGLTPWEATPVQRTAEASPDGRYLAFNSKAELTGTDNIGACLFETKVNEYVGAVPCEEVYLYDSATGELSCASCNPVGEHPHGGSFLRIMGGAEGHLEQPRYLTDSGRLYFDSRDSLVLHDTNDKVEDVYQYEPEGVGTCAKEGGCVSLISAGHEATDSNFLAMDESGKNVFFTTRDQLVLKDHDDLIDLYVAREGGGIPSETETGRSECQGEACQPLYVAPNDPTPGSSSFQGAGNVDEKKAAKKHKKAHKKKHAKKAKKHAKKHKRTKHNRGGAR